MIKGLEIIIAVFASLNVILVPAIGFVIRKFFKIEHRLTRIETLLEKMNNK